MQTQNPMGSVAAWCQFHPQSDWIMSGCRQWFIQKRWMDWYRKRWLGIPWEYYPGWWLTYPSEKKLSSSNGMSLPNIWKVIKFHMVPVTTNRCITHIFGAKTLQMFASKFGKQRSELMVIIWLVSKSIDDHPHAYKKGHHPSALNFGWL